MLRRTESVTLYTSLEIPGSVIAGCARSDCRVPPNYAVHEPNDRVVAGAPNRGGELLSTFRWYRRELWRNRDNNPLRVRWGCGLRNH